MFYQMLDRLFGTSWSGGRTRRRPVRRRSVPLELTQLEDRTVPASLLGATANSFAVLDFRHSRTSGGGEIGQA